MQIEFDDEPSPNIWGWWECPICGEILEDPNKVINTQCHSHHSVTLGYAEVPGDKRYAYFKGDKKVIPED